jgi:hypothetical protein
MPRLATVGEVPVAWSSAIGRYLSTSGCDLSVVFNRLKPVPDPIMVTTGPGAKAGGDFPWEGSDPATGRRYVARKLKGTDAVRLQEVTD